MKSTMTETVRSSGRGGTAAAAAAMAQNEQRPSSSTQQKITTYADVFSLSLSLSLLVSAVLCICTINLPNPAQFFQVYTVIYLLQWTVGLQKQ